VLYQQWITNLITSRTDAAYQHAREFMNIAAGQASTIPKLVAHRITATSHYFKREFGHARQMFDETLALYDENLHEETTYSYGQNPKTACLANLSIMLQVMGYPDQATSVADEALAHARQVQHANTLAYAIWFGPLRTALCQRNPEGTAKYATALATLANEQGAVMWKAYAMTHNGWVASRRKQFANAVELGEAGLSGLQATGTELDKPLAMALLAESHAACGNNNEALSLTDEALETIEQTNERWYEAELIRLKADQLVALSEYDQAEMHYEKSLAVARRQEAKSWELRTATSLAGLWHDRSDREKAVDLLAPIHDWFTEGFETVDLKDAKLLLEQLR
jgi:predicted ATPase